MRQIILILIAALAIVSCGNKSAPSEGMSADSLFRQQDSILANASEFSDTVYIRYAKGLRVDYKKDGIHVTISNPDPASHTKPIELVITEPKSRFVCMTALQLGNFEALGLEERVVGMTSIRHLFNPRIKQQEKEGKTVRIGKEGNFDIEAVIASRPDYIFISTSKHGGYEALKDCGIPLIPHHGYRETNPLGQAEWIKLIGLLTGEPRRANAVFADIETKYNTLKAEVQTSLRDEAQHSADAGTTSRTNSASGTHLPTIISGRQIRDGWYVMGGNSYMAQLFKDAGVDYIMKEHEEAGGLTLDFESVYAKAVNADYWQIDGSFDGEFTLRELEAEDARYADLKAFKNKHVIFCNVASTPYRELSPVEPHILLADFVKAFHPDILPHYTPKYYKLMR